MTLSIAWRHPSDDSIVLVLAGTVDHDSAADLRAAISNAAVRRCRKLVVDLTAVNSVDDIGVGTLVVGGRICRELGIDLAVLGLAADVAAPTP